MGVLVLLIVLLGVLSYLLGVLPIQRQRRRERANSAPPPVRPIEITAQPLQKSAETSSAETVDLPGGPPDSPPGRQAGRDPVEQLERLVRLRDSGSINDAEFETAKAELLKRI